MKKRLLSIAAILLLLAGLLPAVGVAEMGLIGPQYVNTANGKGLYMRSGPSKNYEIITTIPFGAEVDSYQYYNGTWGYVTYRGLSGYCMSRYFSSYRPERPTPTPTHQGGGGGGTANLFNGFTKTNYYAAVRPSTPSGYVNLRWAPSKSQAIEGTYYAGQTLLVLAQNNQWAQVYDESTQTCGFMMLSFLNATGVGSVGAAES